MKVPKTFCLCKRCNGTGVEPDWKALGAKVRKQRGLSELSLRDVAKKINCSIAYLSDLEHGNRAWEGKKARDFLRLFPV